MDDVGSYESTVGEYGIAIGQGRSFGKRKAKVGSNVTDPFALTESPDNPALPPLVAPWELAEHYWNPGGGMQPLQGAWLNNGIGGRLFKKK
jgi:hypothetical protein